MQPNPILPGFHPDPSIVRVDGQYYLVTSTFEYLPGIPVYTSADLKEWTQIGNVIVTDAQGALGDVVTNHGVWAPTIRFRDGLYYVIVTIVGGRGCVVFTASNPAGPWSEGVELAVPGIDPDVAWDSDGVAIVTYSAYSEPMDGVPGHGGIRQVDADLATGRLLSEHRQLWSGTGLQFPEAPHLYEREGLWYLLIAEGGTERGHGVSIARGDNPRGPFTSGPNNPICSASATDRPIQNTGHADLIDLPDGSSGLVLLGVRPLGGNYGFSPLGRESFFTSVEWRDGWPVAEPVREGLDVVAETEHFTFDQPLDDGWLAVRRLPRGFASHQPLTGELCLHGEGTDLAAQAPAFVGRRQRFHYGSVSTVCSVDAGRGGLGVRMAPDAFIEVDAEVVDNQTVVRARAVVPGFERAAEERLPIGRVELGLTFERPNSAGPSDIVRIFARTDDGKQQELLMVDGRYLSAEALSSFTGRVTGLYAVSGLPRFSSLTFTRS